ARDHAQGRRLRLGPDHLQGPHRAGHLRPEDVRDLVQDDPAGAVRLPAGQGAHPPAAGQRVPAGLRPDGTGQGRKGGTELDLSRPVPHNEKGALRRLFRFPGGRNYWATLRVRTRRLSASSPKASRPLPSVPTYASAALTTPQLRDTPTLQSV